MAARVAAAAARAEEATAAAAATARIRTTRGTSAILIILPTLLAVIAWAISGGLPASWRRSATVCGVRLRPRLRRTQPTPAVAVRLASIEASNLKMMGMEEPPQAAEPVAEAITLPHGHVSGTEAAAMMAVGEPPPPSAGWGALRVVAGRRGAAAAAGTGIGTGNANWTVHPPQNSPRSPSNILKPVCLVCLAERADGVPQRDVRPRRACGTTEHSSWHFAGASHAAAASCSYECPSARRAGRP